MFVVIFLAVNFDWSIILIWKSFGASRHISGKLGVKLAIPNRDSPVKKINLSEHLEDLLLNGSDTALDVSFYFKAIICQANTQVETTTSNLVKLMTPGIIPHKIVL